MRFTLPFVLKNPLNGSVGHWSKRSKQRATDRLRCGMYILAAIGKETSGVGRRRVVIMLCRNPAHALDRDGAYASVKPLVDALKDLDHLHNDTEEWLDLHVVQADSTVRQTEVEISD